MNSDDATLQLIRLSVFLIGATVLVTLLARRINLPYTVALVAFGIVAGAVAQPLQVDITPQLVLVVLLPALIFEATYQTDFAKLRPSIAGVALLAGPGVFISALLIAAALHFGAGLAWPEAFVVGAMLSATDPAAVIATFKRLRSPRRLATLVEAESVFNDGTGIVLFALAVDFVTRPVGLAEAGMAFVAVVALSGALGAVAGYVASRILPNVGDHLIEVSLSVVLAYGTYLVADGLHQSGVIATAVAGIVLGTYGRRNGLSPKTEEALDTVWEFVAFLATAFIFLVVGFSIAAHSLVDVAAPIAWAVAAALVGRALIVYGLLGGWRMVLRALGARHQAVAVPGKVARDEGKAARDEAGLPLGWLHVIFWSGLRGAVSTALALSLPLDFPNRAQLQGITFGVVLFTLVVQATTAELVLARWARTPTDPPRSRSDSNPKMRQKPGRSAEIAGPPADPGSES
ncbi:MAG TPA: sodium:proton antiporter [Terriglobales bacterium]|nr:sodium:proton antiporter [Terriglobales bacterium]